MKKITLLLIVALSACSSPNVVRNSIVNDFRGIAFGSSLSSDMQYESTYAEGYDRIKSYTKHNEELAFGHIEVQKIIYSYFDGKLYSVDITVGEDARCLNAKSLADGLSEKYGSQLEQIIPNAELNNKFYLRKFRNLHISVMCNTVFSKKGMAETYVSISEPRLYEVAKQYGDSVLNDISSRSSSKISNDF
ncbi:hypothetical protein ACIGBN_05685 [Marinomonas sp. NPDC078689]|jgi:hypothetical protein|uniref:hypothetical protein n=1 Tax=Marinomonas sp. NPDC078689 TaxID=3364147 RepID=UPI0037CA272D